MKFVPKFTEENVNVTPKSPLIEALWITASVIFLIIAFYGVSGLLLDLVIPYLPESIETPLAGIFQASIKFKTLEHQEKGKIQNMVTELSNLIPDNKREFFVQIISDKEFNAFAIPGGTILLLQGLLDKVKSEQELAFVLCHEMGHFHHRDHLKAIGRKLLGFVVMAFVFGGNNPLNSTIQSTFSRLDLKHSQKQELAADEFALDLLNRRYGNINGAFEFFNSLKNKEKFPEFLYFFSTHPKPDDRINVLKQIARDRNYKYNTELFN